MLSLRLGPSGLAMSLSDTLVAAGEVAGRHAISRFGTLRQHIGRSSRTPSGRRAPVTLQELECAIVHLGVRQGEVLMVHSAWDGMRQLQAKPSDLIKSLLSLVGPTGTLIMPTEPSLGTDQNTPTYDLARSPSVRGLISESFRRMEASLRSPFPVGTVSAMGSHASALTQDFRDRSNNTPYGYGSPYWELVQMEGKVLVLGVDVVRTLSLMHCAFDILGEEIPIRGYYTEWPVVVLNDGRKELWRVRRQDPKWENYYASSVFARMIDRSGTSRSANVNGLKIAVVDAKPFLEWHLPLAKCVGWPFWGFPRARKGAS